MHVHVGAEVLEVSTFRAAQKAEESTDEHGRLLSDNVYGTQHEDAARRDFTINALYFDPSSEEIWDYVGGVTDTRARRLKLIGAPVTRFREDPVRMLRAVRLAAKCGLAIDPKTAAPISKLAGLIQNVPPARLFDEMQKLLLSGHAVETLSSLRAHGLSHGLLPLLDMILEQPLGTKFIEVALAGTDARVRDGKSVSPAFLFATLLWHEVLQQWNAAKSRGEKPLPALFDAMDRVLGAQAERMSIPRRLEATIKEIWTLQPRFEQRAGARPLPPARARALSRGLRLPGTARGVGRGPAGAGRLVEALPGRRRGRAGVDAPARRGAEEGPALARARAQAARGRRRRRRHDAGRRVARRELTAPAALNPTVAFVGLGSNLAHPRRQVARAVAALRRLPRTRLVRISPNFATAPVGGGAPQPDYVNAVAMLRTALAPRALLARMQAIERRQLRRRDPEAPRNAPRTLDLDLLLYGARRIAVPGLTVPHPRMHERAFVLHPLRAIAPAARIPGRGIARRFRAAVRGQRAARTRTHHLN